MKDFRIQRTQDKYDSHPWKCIPECLSDPGRNGKAFRLDSSSGRFEVKDNISDPRDQKQEIQPGSPGFTGKKNCGWRKQGQQHCKEKRNVQSLHDLSGKDLPVFYIMNKESQALSSDP